MKNIKVKLTEESKKTLFIADIDRAKKIMDEFNNPADYGLTMEDIYSAARLVLGYGNSVEKIFEPKAEIYRNNRVWNAYNDDSNDLDIWVEFYVLGWNKFCEVGIYLTDIWSISGDNRDEILPHVWVKEYNHNR